jgi:ribose/xylose/arabinose/galactoside ABC-type transport system permease subunit
MQLQSILGSRNTEDLAMAILDNMIWPILLLVCIVISIAVPATFQNLQSLRLVLFNAAPLGLLVLAESFCLLSGHFDLSIGSIAGFSAIFTGMLLGTCPSCWAVISSPLLGIGVIIFIGAVIGLTNGILIGKFGINPFLQTLSFLIIFQGAKLAITTQPVTGLPQAYLYLGGHAYTSIGLFIIAFLIAGAGIRYFNFGQSIYAIGSNKESARAVGVNTDRVIIAVFTLSGALAGIAGLLITGYTTVVPPNIAEGMVFPAFAATIIGGVSLFGGRGKIVNALGGVLLLSVIQAALNISGVPASMVNMMNGIVLFLAIILYTMRTRFRSQILTGAESE